MMAKVTEQTIKEFKEMLRAKRDEFQKGLLLLEDDLATLEKTGAADSIAAAGTRIAIAWRKMQIESVNFLLEEGKR